MTIKEEVQRLIKSGVIKLKCSQDKLCIPIIARLLKKMRAGLTFNAIKIAGDIICNGHHRYIASLLANVPIDRDPYVITNATEIKKWESIQLDEDDWESEDIIHHHNENDASRNNMKISELNDLLSNITKKV